MKKIVKPSSSWNPAICSPTCWICSFSRFPFWRVSRILYNSAQMSRYSLMSFSFWPKQLPLLITICGSPFQSLSCLNAKCFSAPNFRVGSLDSCFIAAVWICSKMFCSMHRSFSSLLALDRSEKILASSETMIWITQSVRKFMQQKTRSSRKTPGKQIGYQISDRKEGWLWMRVLKRKRSAALKSIPLTFCTWMTACKDMSMLICSPSIFSSRSKLQITLLVLWERGRTGIAFSVIGKELSPFQKAQCSSRCSVLFLPKLTAGSQVWLASRMALTLPVRQDMS